MCCVCGDVESEKHVLLDCNLDVDVRRRWKEKMNAEHGIQTIQPTSGVAVTAVTNCCENCVELPPTTLNKRVWICYVFYKQIHVRKQISIR